jgi:carboxyl-terminal processing protease
MIHYRKHALPIIALTVGAVISLLFIPIGDKSAFSDRDGKRNTIIMLGALNEVIKKSERYFYKEVDREEMYEGAIKGALAALDDNYTFYLSPRILKRETENVYHGAFGGLGIQIQPEKGFIKITRPLPNSPALRAGLRAGDYITNVNGDRINISSSGQSIYDVVDILRGKVGTQVTITVQRRGDPVPFDVTLTREVIKPPSVEKEMLGDGIGYILIRQFTGRTSQEFQESLEELHRAEGDGLKSLILDLRYNSGGLLDAAYFVADAFISEGVIVSTQGRNQDFNREYMARPTILCDPDVNLVVLVNGYSASGAEIVAGAIKDVKRGTLLGTKTYGKGVVQHRYPLEKVGGAVSLTISTYYTPSGVSINKEGNKEGGITPHLIVDSTLDIVDVAKLEKAGKHVKAFVEKWIEEEEKRTGEPPKEFSKIEVELPQLMDVLAEDDIVIDPKLVKFNVRRIFNFNVGLNPIIDLEYDTQLREAVRIIKAGEVEEIPDSTTTVSVKEQHKPQPKVVSITDSQVKRLSRLATATDEGLSELVRHAVDNFLDSQEVSMGLGPEEENTVESETLDSPVSSTDK